MADILNKTSMSMPVVKAGVLFKKGSGTGFLQRKNWKPRYFELTQNSLRYYTFQDGELKGEINLKCCGEDVLEIMPEDSKKTGGSASTIWRLAINAPSRRLLIAANTEHEMNDWVDALLAVFHANTNGTDVIIQRNSVATKEMDFASMPHIKKSNGSPSRNSSATSAMFGRPSHPYYGEQEFARNSAPAYVEQEITRPAPTKYVPTPEPILYPNTHPEHIVHLTSEGPHSMPPPKPIVQPVVQPVVPSTTASSAPAARDGPGNFDPSGEYAF